MKTVVFHSYKGGVGRTLALVNFATALSRMGKRVVVLDLDIDAPGLNDKIANLPGSVLPGGYVDYLAYYYDDGPDRQQKSSIRVEPERSRLVHKQQMLRQYAHEIVTTPEGEADKRSYLLLLAGSCDPKYWWNLASPWFNRLFAVSRNEFAHDNGIRLHNHRSFFREERDVLAGVCDGGTDYLLVDCKSAREYSSVPLYYWADVVVSMLPANAEGVGGAVAIHQAIQSVAERNVQIIPVVCRVTPGYDLSDIRKEVDQKFGQLARDNGDPEVARLTEFGGMTVNEKLAFGATQFGSGRPLTLVDHAKLFERICKALKRGDATHDFGPTAAEWRRVLIGDDHTLEDVDVVRDVDAIVRNRDGSRNVMLRDVSLRLIFDTLARTINTTGAAGRREVAQSFRRAGASVGRDFGRQVVEHGIGAERPREFSSRVSRWCEYDGENAGFGVMTPTIQDRGRVVKVTWRQCFLVSEGQISTHALAFLTGYLEGALSSLHPSNGQRRQVNFVADASFNGQAEPLSFTFRMRN